MGSNRREEMIQNERNKEALANFVRIDKGLISSKTSRIIVLVDELNNKTLRSDHYAKRCKTSLAIAIA